MHDAFKSAAYGLAVLLAGCSASNEAELQALHAEVARLQAELQTLRKETARLQSEVKMLEAQRSIARQLANKVEPGVWAFEWNDVAKVGEPRIVEKIPADRANAKAIVSALNRRHAVPGVYYVAQRGVIVYLRVRDPEHLTQRMGTSGALEYLGVVVVSLTSLPGVELVHFDFPEGDHGAPGYYSRADFVLCC